MIHDIVNVIQEKKSDPLYGAVDAFLRKPWDPEVTAEILPVLKENREETIEIMEAVLRLKLKPAAFIKIPGLLEGIQQPKGPYNQISILAALLLLMEIDPGYRFYYISLVYEYNDDIYEDEILRDFLEDYLPDFISGKIYGNVIFTLMNWAQDSTLNRYWRDFSLITLAKAYKSGALKKNGWMWILELVLEQRGDEGESVLVPVNLIGYTGLQELVPLAERIWQENGYAEDSEYKSVEERLSQGWEQFYDPVLGVNTYEYCTPFFEKMNQMYLPKGLDLTEYREAVDADWNQNSGPDAKKTTLKSIARQVLDFLQDGSNPDTLLWLKENPMAEEIQKNMEAILHEESIQNKKASAKRQKSAKSKRKNQKVARRQNRH